MERVPEPPERLIGGLGWLAIGAVVAGWDLSQDETLSSAFRRYQPYSGIVLAYTAAHLMGWLPPRIDLYNRLARQVAYSSS